MCSYGEEVDWKNIHIDTLLFAPVSLSLALSRLVVAYNSVLCNLSFARLGWCIGVWWTERCGNPLMDIVYIMWGWLGALWTLVAIYHRRYCPLHNCLFPYCNGMFHVLLLKCVVHLFYYYNRVSCNPEKFSPKFFNQIMLPLSLNKYWHFWYIPCVSLLIGCR